MDPVAILITAENCESFAMELRSAHPNLNGYQPSYWIGYYLVVTEGGPEILAPHKFHEQWEFPYFHELRPIVAKS